MCVTEFGLIWLPVTGENSFFSHTLFETIQYFLIALFYSHIIDLPQLFLIQCIKCAKNEDKLLIFI